ncbi:MAG: hypothetical protein HN341_00530, partial [Verrucomicrobia bacterium]|nr:hypothetical protein [Verrucomicrobiota bacterium]
MSPTEQSARRNSDDTVLHGAEPEQSRCPGASPGAALAGGDISNTPPPSSKWVAAEDWMDIAFYVDWHADKWEALTKRLDECKTYAAMKDAPEEVTGWFAKGTRIEVDPTGARSGKGKKGIYCAWKFTWADALCFRIVNRSRIHETMPNVFVTVDGTACLTKNATDWYQDAKRLIEILGGVIRQDKLSRVDICLDMPHVPIDELVSCFDEGRYICRANAIGKLESNGKTIYFGESPIKARIYDKLREVQKKADPIKTLAMQLWRWRGSGFPDAATRVEFQIRREGLKTRGIDSVQDYLDRRASLVKYLTKEWLRLTLDHVDKEN